MTRKYVFRSGTITVLAILMLVTGNTSFAKEQIVADSPKTIAIIGNSELPKVEAPLPWRVAGSADPTKIQLQKEKMPDALSPISVSEHRERVFFDKHIKVDTERSTKY